MFGTCFGSGIVMRITVDLHSFMIERIWKISIKYSHIQLCKIKHRAPFNAVQRGNFDLYYSFQSCSFYKSILFFRKDLLEDQWYCCKEWYCCLNGIVVKKVLRYSINKYYLCFTFLNMWAPPLPHSMKAMVCVTKYFSIISPILC